jgi:uncharacterized protein
MHSGTLRRLTAAALVQLAIAGWLAAFAHAQADLPALTGRVVDNAGVIDAATEQALTAKLAAFEAKSSDQIVVATVPSLGGDAIEPYANRLFRAWKLGQGGEDNGILLLVAVNDRKMRIEVGYGLEGTLTDLHSRLIIEDTMVPAFRAGNYAAGIDGAVDDIITVLEGNGAELEARAKRNQAQDDDGIPVIVILFLIVWGTLFFGSFALAMMARIYGRRIGPGRYRWLGMDFDYNNNSGGGRSSSGSGWSSGSGSGWSGGSSSGGGFSGGGGSSGGGGASGSW